MDLELKGKIAVITGASRGIGFAIAERLMDEGCEVRLVARDAARLEAARAKLAPRHSGEIRLVAADLAEVDDAKRVFPLLEGADILVNSAGAVPRGTVLDVSAERFRTTFAGKVMGAIDLCRAVLPGMAARRSGVIVNIAGVAGERPNPKSIATGTANAALMAFSQALGSASVDDGVRVLCLNPGLIATERTTGLTDPSNRVDSTAYAHVLKTLPFGRMGTVTEIADMVAFLCSPRASYVSGTVFTVDGGMRFRA